MSDKNYKVSICLSKFKNTVILDTKRKKVKCIVIPIEENDIFISKKGACYIKRTSYKTGKEYKQYLPKEIQETIRKELKINKK
jgi:hypothetical protein